MSQIELCFAAIAIGSILLLLGIQRHWRLPLVIALAAFVVVALILLGQLMRADVLAEMIPSSMRQNHLQAASAGEYLHASPIVKS